MHIFPFLTCAALLVMGLAAAVDAADAVDPRSAVYEINLAKAGPGDKAFEVALRTEGGRFVDGISVAPGLNNMAQEVDCSGLRLEDAAINGMVKITFVFDGYGPAGGKPLACEYDIDARIDNGKVTGKFDGVYGIGAGNEKMREQKFAGDLTGTVAAPAGLGGYWALDIQMENGRGAGPLGKDTWGNRVYPKLIWKDGELVQSFIHGWGGRAQINYLECAVAKSDLALDDKRLRGAITAKATSGDEYVFTFDGKAVGSIVGGTFAKKLNGKDAPGAPFRGTLRPMPQQPVNQALFYLELHDAVDGKHQLMAFAPRVAGAFGEGMAYSGSWNHTYHDIDAAGLKLDGDALSGELRAVMNPDPYMPADRKPRPGAYTISARVIDGRLVQGTYSGTFHDQKVSGIVIGEVLEMPAVPEPVGLYLKLDDGVNEGAPWFRRVFLGFTAVNGQADKGGMSNNKRGWTGTFKRAQVKFDGTRFTATIDGSIDTTKGPTKGDYTFKLTGKVIGKEIVGTVDTFRDGKPTKSGTAFMGSFGAPKAGAATMPAD